MSICYVQQSLNVLSDVGSSFVTRYAFIMSNVHCLTVCDSILIYSKDFIILIVTSSVICRDPAQIM